VLSGISQYMGSASLRHLKVIRFTDMEHRMLVTREGEGKKGCRVSVLQDVKVLEFCFIPTWLGLLLNLNKKIVKMRNFMTSIFFTTI
jgi:hypothetical protein